MVWEAVYLLIFLGGLSVQGKYHEVSVKIILYSGEIFILMDRNQEISK